MSCMFYNDKDYLYIIMFQFAKIAKIVYLLICLFTFFQPLKTEFHAKLWGGCARTWDRLEENDEKLCFSGLIWASGDASGTGF